MFKVGDNTPFIDNGVLYLMNEYISQENYESKTKISIIDDKNIARPTLGLRRLQIDKKVIYPLYTTIYTLQDLIKLAKPKSWFIDNSGNIFQYKKTTRAKLQTYEINQILPINSIGCVLEIKGFSERFKSLTVPDTTQRYAAILTYKGKNLLYGLYSQNIEPTWRLV